ncbi:MAG: adenylate/guanylate cyclase domain-containing protein [Bacteroidales bacterium]
MDEYLTIGQPLLPDDLPHVWIIEDDRKLGALIQRSLEKQGYECLCFFSGKDLLDFLQAHRQTPDAIMLLDYLLEDTNAVELIEQVRSHECHNPFIIMTAFGDEKIAVELMKLGAMDYVIKEKFFTNQISRALQQVSQKIDTQKKLERSQLELKRNTEKLKEMNRQIILQKLALENEKAKTDKLLQSILPVKIAEELLDKGFSKPRQYESVSILFADVIGFSDLAKNSHPIELVTRLDNYFYVFDEIIEQYGLEKIKTIGDCYMCAGGIPEENPSNAVTTVLAGLRIQLAVESLKDDFNAQLPHFRLRLGIHSGQVVAGIVGKNKFAYDIWGDAVNIASRIVEAGVQDRVNISEKTYRLVKDYFEFEERGEINTKRNHPMKMYFVNRLKPEFSADKQGLTPSARLLRELNIKQGVRYY